MGSGFLRRRARWTLLLGGLAGLGFGAAASGQPPPKAQADELYQKLREINLHAVSGNGAARLTPVSEGEVNAFLYYHGPERLPTGVTDPEVHILGDGRVSGTAIVDLDRIRKARQSGAWLDPMNLLTGRLAVTAEGILHTRGGQGRFDLQSADISGVPVPKVVLQELVTFYSRTPQDPDGVSLDEPFELPSAIQEIRVAVGEAVVVQ